MTIPIDVLAFLLMAAGIIVRILLHSLIAVLIFAATVWIAGSLYRVIAPSVGMPQPTLYEAGRDAWDGASQKAGAIVHPPTATPVPSQTPTPTRTATPTVTSSPTASRTATRVPTNTPLAMPELLARATARARAEDTFTAKWLRAGVTVRWAPSGYFTFCSFESSQYWEGEILMNPHCQSNRFENSLIQSVKGAAWAYESASLRKAFCRVPKYDWRKCESQGGPKPPGKS